MSYLVANPSRDSILAVHQQLTRQWWQDWRQHYHCVTSSEVLREASLGDIEMSRRRIEALAGLTILKVDEPVRKLARAILAERLLPPVAASDAIHAVVAAQHRVNILVTWNCRHLANPHLLAKCGRSWRRTDWFYPRFALPLSLWDDDCMKADPILEEIWRIKDELSREFAADPDAYFAKLDEIADAEEKVGRKVIRSAAELHQHVIERQRQVSEASALAINDKLTNKEN